MALMDFKVPKREVSFGEFHGFVRGASLNDISFVLRDHLTEVNRLMSLYEDEEKRNTALAQAANFAITLVGEAPLLAATLIVCCSDEEPTSTLVKHVAAFGIGLQTELLRNIWELTVEDAGGAKKLLDNFMGMVKKVRPASLTGA